MRRPSQDPARTFWPALFSSEREDWQTPPALVARLATEFGAFDLDPCATPQSAKAPRFFTLADDGLAQPWAPARVFMNPPYGRLISEWMRKARTEATRGAFVVCLVHARTDTRWWHEHVEGHAAFVRFLRGRVRFLLTDGSRFPAPFPSAVVIYGGRIPQTFSPSRPGSGWVGA